MFGRQAPRRALPLALTATSLFVAALHAGPARAQTLDPGVAADLVHDTVVRGLSNLTAAAFTPDGRMVILQQDGQIFVWTGSGRATAAGTIPVNFDGGERGLLDVAIDPEFATSNRLYIYYSAANVSAEVRNRVAWVTLDPTTNRVDPASLHDVLVGIYGPRNHDGGGLAFGPDGYLYIGTGDTGCNCGCAPGTGTNMFGTCLTNLNGKILRIDRDGGVPASNPLVNVAAVTACGPTSNDCTRALDPGVTAAPKAPIYAWGFRNAWRFSFDPDTGWLWIGDVGEVTWEEITVSKGPGEHHGWPLREGFHGQDRSACTTVTPNTTGPCVEPVFEYAHSENPNNAASVTGGVFSSHCSWPTAWRGRYWFGDYVANRVWTLTPSATRDAVEGGRTTIVTGANAPVHFFNGVDGAIYYVSNSGSIGRIAPAAPVACEVDAGTPDTGPAPVDAAAPSEDAAAAAPDATTAEPDASAPSPADAAVAVDGGAIAGETTSSCGCTEVALRSAAGCGSAVLFVALALGLSARRRRHR